MCVDCRFCRKNFMDKLKKKNFWAMANLTRLPHFHWLLFVLRMCYDILNVPSKDELIPTFNPLESLTGIGKIQVIH